MNKLDPRRYIAEFRRIFQDPVLFIGLVLVVIFVVVAIIAPIFAMIEESGTPDGQELFDRYLRLARLPDDHRQHAADGLIVAALGTALGFLMAYVQVKVDVPSSA